MEEIKIRTANLSDSENILKIYEPYIIETAITFEYDVPELKDFEKRIQTTLEKYPYIVAEKNGDILGYAYASPFKGRIAYNHCAEVSIYVKKGSTGLGIGKKLYNVLEGILKLQGIINLYAFITLPDAGNDVFLDRNSYDFHKHMGYKTVGEFLKSGYKFERWYNVVCMEKLIGRHTESPDEIKWFSAFEDEFKDIYKKIG